MSVNMTVSLVLTVRSPVVNVFNKLRSLRNNAGQIAPVRDSHISIGHRQSYTFWYGCSYM